MAVTPAVEESVEEPSNDDRPDEAEKEVRKVKGELIIDDDN